MAALEVRLRIRRIVVATQHEVVEGILARQVNHLLVGRKVLLAAAHPVRERCLRDQALQEIVLLLLAARQPFHLLLVLEDGVAEDVGTVVAVIARLLMARRLTGARRAHDRTEDVKFHLRVLLAERLEAVGAHEYLFLAVLVLARADEASVEHRVRRDDGSIGILRVLLEPIPELIGVTEIRAADDFRRLLVRDWAVVVRDVEDLLYFLFILVVRRGLWHASERHGECTEHCCECYNLLSQRIAPLLSHSIFFYSSWSASTATSAVLTSSGTLSFVSNSMPPSFGLAPSISSMSMSLWPWYSVLPKSDSASTLL